MATKPTLALIGLILLAGCAPTGLLYTNVVTPYTSSFDATKVGTRQCIITDDQIREPLTTGIRAEWTRGKIQEEASKAGIQDINYIDKKTKSFLLSIYKRETLIVYGE